MKKVVGLIVAVLLVLVLVEVFKHVEVFERAASLIGSTTNKDTANTATTNANASIEPSDVPKGVSREFYETMVSYEAFFDEYVVFMEKYAKSSNQSGMLMDYLDYMTKYADAMQKLEGIDEKKLTRQEDAYYVEVSLRINQKLIKVAQAID
jgi:hypothetical protein